MKNCCIDDCSSPVLARGWCRKHYLRWFRNGDPLILVDRLATAKRGQELPQFKHGKWKNPLYPTWHTMMKRCYDPKNAKYERYGGRGITVDDRWHDVANFIADMGERPPGTSLDRKDNDGPYSVDNCRWATAVEQARNRPQATLTDEQRSEAVRLYGITGSPKAVSEQLGLGVSSVKNVVYGEKRRTFEKVKGAA